jgi:hypothetical protein
MQRGFRPGAGRKTREPPRTGTSLTTPEESSVAAEEGGWGRRSKSRVKERLRVVAGPEKPKGSFKAVVLNFRVTLSV